LNFYKHARTQEHKQSGEEEEEEEEEERIYIHVDTKSNKQTNTTQKKQQEYIFRTSTHTGNKSTHEASMPESNSNASSVG
jgi:hypothetical protein